MHLPFLISSLELTYAQVLQALPTDVHRKGTLRIVTDCSPTIKAALEAAHAATGIDFAHDHCTFHLEVRLLANMRFF